MAFWTQVSSSPTRNYRFLIQADGPGELKGNWYWAKSISKPSYEISNNTYQIGNHNIKYPGTLTWSDVSLKMVDTGTKTKELYDNLSAMGYEVPDANNAAPGIRKNADTSLSQFLILQLNDKGETIEKWTLMNAFVTSADFGSLSYDSDDLVEINITIAYDYAKFE